MPPPNWVERIGETYNETNIPSLKDDEHFQNWMRTAGLPEFTKLYGRNDDDKLVKGTYELTIYLRTYARQELERRRLTWVICTRLPREELQGHKVNRDLDGVVGGWEEPLPRMGIRRRGRAVHSARRPRHDPPPCPSTVRPVVDTFAPWVLTVRQSHRRLGDMSLLSWNR